MMLPVPQHFDLNKTAGLSVTWTDGTVSFYPAAHLRRLSPSADQRELREQMARNPLTVLPSGGGGGGGGGGSGGDGAGGDVGSVGDVGSGGVQAIGVELVGNYAIRIKFSDGHDTGIYTWDYLREIDPGPPTG